MSKLVSVIITTYNRLDLFKKSLNSVLEQSYKNYEIIVIDGSDNQNTGDYIEKNKKIKYYKSNNSHPNYLRNKGIELSSGELIAFLDDDDIWDKEKIKKQVTCFQQNEIGLCYTGKNIVDHNEKFIKYSFKKQRFANAFISILWDNFIGTTSSIMVQSKVCKAIGNFDESLPALQDYDFCIRVCKQFKVRGINEALLNYRYNYSNLQLSKNNIKFGIACKLIKSKYKYKLLNFGLYKINFKRKLKAYYE